MKKLLTISFLVLAPNLAHAHAIVGDRVFPATMEIDDPDVEDELTLPQVESFKEHQDDGSNAWVTTYSTEYSKRITQNFGLSVDAAYINQSKGAGGGDGFDNFGGSAKYVFIRNAPHEFMASIGVDAEIGNTGSRLVGADRFDTITPQVFFGKGMGDLPDSADYVKPFAITGQIGAGFPTKLQSDGQQNPTTFNYGFSLQYSLPYLQQHVKDIGLEAPFINIIPLVEVNMQTPVAHNNGSNATTGTINPGFIWEGTTSQIGLEAELPVNNASGHGVGVVAQYHLFFDDIFSTSIGKPIFN